MATPEWPRIGERVVVDRYNEHGGSRFVSNAERSRIRASRVAHVVKRAYYPFVGEAALVLTECGVRYRSYELTHAEDRRECERCLAAIEKAGGDHAQ